MPKDDAYVIRRSRQLRALASPVRSEILDALEALGAVTVRRLAEHMGRSAESLYYHLQMLDDVGLISRTSSRGETGRTEAVIRLIAPHMNVAPSSSSPGYEEAVTKAAGATLRLTEREFKRAFLARRGERSGPTKEIRLRRRVIRLEADALVELNKRLEDLDVFLADNDAGDEGPAYAVTIAMAPVGQPKPE